MEIAKIHHYRYYIKILYQFSNSVLIISPACYILYVVIIQDLK